MKWLAVILLAAGCSSNVVISNDNGGRLDKYAARVERYQDKSVVLCGHIDSAATMYLSLPNVCACPDALFRFHGARVMWMYDPVGTQILASYYSPRLREWFLREAAHLYGPQNFKVLTAKELEQMGAVTLCESS